MILNKIKVRALIVGSALFLRQNRETKKITRIIAGAIHLRIHRRILEKRTG